MNDTINEIAIKHNLPSSWINTDFINTKSYSRNIALYSSFYRSYSNGSLLVRTIKDEYLLAMKVMSGRKYKNDYSDIYGIVMECIKQNKVITIDVLEKAIINLYGTIENVDKTAFEFARKVIISPDSVSMSEIKSNELSNANVLKTNLKNNPNQEEIDYILSKLK